MAEVLARSVPFLWQADTFFGHCRELLGCDFLTASGISVADGFGSRRFWLPLYMLLSSDELEILEFLKALNGEFISMLEICRRAGGRRKFKEEPNWANGLMGRLVDANLVTVNERGHYKIITGTESPEDGNSPFIIEQQIIGDDYFPAHHDSKVIGEDFFPSPSMDASQEETRWWVKPDLLDLPKRKKKGKNGH